MKLIVPYRNRMHDVDARLIRLAEFLGVICVPIRLNRPAEQYVGLLETVACDGSCFVIHPATFREWTGGCLPPGLAEFLCSRFSRLIIHAPECQPFDNTLVSALTGGQFERVDPIGSPESYKFMRGANDICEAFSGLCFGAANCGNDRVFQNGGPCSLGRTLISIGGKAFMAEVKRENTTILLIGSGDVAELDCSVNSLTREYFSRLLPHAMALRNTFGEECWRPNRGHACLIVDDPLLQKRYGFLQFDNLLRMMKERDFHTTIAFIPHNFRRSSAAMAAMFKENPQHFSICFHGNDHMGAEFAACDTTLLNSMLGLAEIRIAAHHIATGLPCDRVMVFPQGHFSLEAMAVLQSRNFDCAVNTSPYPRSHAVPLTLSDLIQPALLRYSGFPLFLRTKLADVSEEHIASNLFFGKPVMIVEHHDGFQDPRPLLDAVDRINSVAPGISWSNVGVATANSFLKRRSANGEHQIRAYSRTVSIENDGEGPARCSVTWCGGQASRVRDVVLDGSSSRTLEIDAGEFRTTLDLEPHDSRHLALVFHNQGRANSKGLGIQRTTRAFLRRRLSEVRDNYLSKSLPILNAAKAVQRCLSR